MKTDVREIVTAYLHNDRVHLVAPGGEIVDRLPAEYSFFLKVGEVRTGIVRSLGESSAVREMREEEGGWIRVVCRDYESRKGIVERYLQDANGVAVYEGDVTPIRRVLAENPIRITTPRLAWLDIETDSRVKFRNKHEARVLSWCVVREDGKRRLRVLDVDTDAAERSLLKDLYGTLSNFDCVAVWGSPVSEAFDFEVLDARAKWHQMRWRSRRVLTLDYLKVWEKMNRMAAESGDEKASLKLEDIAQATLGHGKVKTPEHVIQKFGNRSMGALTWQLWNEGGEWRELMARYNWQDTDLLRQLEAEKGYAALFFSVCEVTNCLPETRSLNTTQQIDGYLLRHGAEIGVRWPTKPREAIAGDQYRGAWVMPPSVHGIERDVHVFDFKSMYPSIMLTWNMSPETIIEEGSSYKGPFCTAATGARFRTDKEGILAGVLRGLMKLRDHWKAEKKKCPPGTREWHLADARTSGYKSLINAFYGILGSTFSRFKNRLIAEAVTQTGVDLIKKTIELAESERWSFRTLYADTDGKYAQGGTVDRANEFAAVCNRDLYPAYARERGCTGNYLSVAYEKAFKLIVWPRSDKGKFASKRYAGKYAHYEGKAATADSKPEVKGLECKRGDAPRLTRRMQEEVIELLIAKECSDPVDFGPLISRWRTMLLEGSLEREDVVISNSLSRDPEFYATRKKNDGSNTLAPVHVEIAKILKAKGDDVSEGTRIEFVVMSSDPIKAVHADEWDGVTCDREYLWNSRVWPASARLLRGAFPGVDWDAWLVTKPKLRGGKPVPEEQVAFLDSGNLKSFLEGEPTIARLTRRRGEITVRVDHKRNVSLGEVKKILAESRGRTKVVLEIVTPRGTAVCDLPDRVDLSPSAERALRALGAEVFAG